MSDLKQRHDDQFAAQPGMADGNKAIDVSGLAALIQLAIPLIAQILAMLKPKSATAQGVIDEDLAKASEGLEALKRIAARR